MKTSHLKSCENRYCTSCRMTVRHDVYGGQLVCQKCRSSGVKGVGSLWRGGEFRLSSFAQVKV